MRQGISVSGWLLAVFFILLLITGTNLFLISRLGNQANRKVNILTKSPSQSVSVNLPYNQSSEEIMIIPQNPLVRSYGSLELVLLQNLTLEKYELNGSTAVLYLKYWLNERPHTLRLEVRTQFGTDKGLAKIKDGVFGTNYKVGDILNITLSYLLPQNYPAVNSEKIRETIEKDYSANPGLKADLINKYKLFGDKPVSLDQLKTILQQDEAILDSATVTIITITNTNSKP